MACTLPGFSVHVILQTRILEWVAIPSTEDLPNPRVEPRSPALHTESLLSEPEGKPLVPVLQSKYLLFMYFIYGNVHLLGLYSQFVPPPSLPLW